VTQAPPGFERHRVEDARTLWCRMRAPGLAAWLVRQPSRQRLTGIALEDGLATEPLP
jgi:hypothetical protein